MASTPHLSLDQALLVYQRVMGAHDEVPDQSFLAPLLEELATLHEQEGLLEDATVLRARALEMREAVSRNAA